MSSRITDEIKGQLIEFITKDLKTTTIIPITVGFIHGGETENKFHTAAIK
jgi:hypothetical protein